MIDENLTVNWVFDNPDKFKTMSACPDTMHADDLSYITGRFPVPNFFWYWKYEDSLKVFGLSNRPTNYCYNIGTWVYPEHWAGYENNTNGHKNLFELIPNEVLNDARNNKALIVIDSLNEGFQDDRLYEFWHKSCDRYNIPPKSILYVTSNEAESHAYNLWADSRNIPHRINNITFCHLENSQRHCLTTSYKELSWEDHVLHKGNKLTIKDFNCLNRINRWHREYFVIRLIGEDLHQHGLISHNRISAYLWGHHDLISTEVLEKVESLLPLVIDDPDFDHNKAMHINHNIYLNSWLSVVTETHADDDKKCFFMSEKIWKPIYALHPFMVLGDQGVLSKLKQMGYKTFDGLLDESYDNAAFMDRVEILIKNLKRMRIIKDKAGWFNECRDICIHNRKVFVEREFFESLSYKDFISLYSKLEK